MELKILNQGYDNLMLAYYIEYREGNKTKIIYFDTIKERAEWINDHKKNERMPIKK